MDHWTTTVRSESERIKQVHRPVGRRDKRPPLENNIMINHGAIYLLQMLSATDRQTDTHRQRLKPLPLRGTGRGGDLIMKEAKN